MRQIILLLVFISFSGYSQNNQFTGTWSNENCKDCSKKYILKLNIAESNSQIFGTAEVISTDEKLNSGIMEITGHVYKFGEKAQINIKDKNGLSAGAVLYTHEGALQFDKRGGSDLVPQEAVLTKLYD
jgi:hypothetical protein